LLDGKPRAFFFHQSPQMRPASRPEGPVVGMNEDARVVQRLSDLMVGHVKLVERKSNDEFRRRAASRASAVVCRVVVVCLSCNPFGVVFDVVFEINCDLPQPWYF
jgi:hypothetical protein